MKQKLLYILMITALLFAYQTEGYAIFDKVHPQGYYESNARECFRQNKWQEGKEYLDAGWNEFGSASVMNELMGKYYYHYKKYDKARYYLVRALRDDHSNSQAREIIVNVEEETHNYSSAICYINELLESNPYSRGLWRRKINIYRKQGNSAEADRLLERLQQIYPDDDVVKKDVAYINEQRLSKSKHDGNLTGQLDALGKLVSTYPSNADYCMQYVNTLAQAGRNDEAVEVAARGARQTGSTALMSKRASILADLGRYTEAVNYLKECIRNHPSSSLNATLNNIELSMAENAQMNDPYTSMAKVYSKQKSAEALTYLLNTSIARGYYDDALMYIKEAKRSRGETEDLLYKEFLVNFRLGNKGRAESCLLKIHKKNPRNSEVNEYLCEMRYAEAADEMGFQQYSEAIPRLEFVQEYATDNELKKGAMLRLYNCFYESKRFDQAQEQLTLINKTFPYENYTYQQAALLHAEGRTDTALRFLAGEFDKTLDPSHALLISYQYEEYAIPYIKDMIEKGMIRQADRTAKAAIIVCPTSNDLLHYAITTADLLGNFDDYEEMVLAGRARYPNDPFFIVKEANVLSRQGDHAAAVNLLHPELNAFSGDEAMVGAFAEASRELAAEQAKAHDYRSALATLDTALVYRIGDRELLVAKGEIYETMGKYDSAYVYQRYYQPSLMDYRQHTRHLEELKTHSFSNSVIIGYTHANSGNGVPKASDANVTFTHGNRRNGFALSLDYTGREHNATGAAVQVGATWRHDFVNSSWKTGLNASWGSDFFPQITVGAYAQKPLKHDYTLNIHATYRRLQLLDSETAEQKYHNSALAGITLTKRMDMFSLQATADATLLDGKAYVGGNVKGCFFPLENSATNIYAIIGAGNAPQSSLLNKGFFCGYGKVNTCVEAGLWWYFTRHISTSLSASMYNQRLSQPYIFGITPAEWLQTTADTDALYRNTFLLQAKLHVAF